MNPPAESALLRLAIARGLLRWEDLDAVAAHLPEDVRTAATTFDIGVEQAGAKLVLGHKPGGVDRLVAEVRMFACDALSPCSKAVGFELDQEDAAASGQTEAGLEWMGQRHVDLAHMDGVDVEHLQFLSFRLF